MGRTDAARHPGEVLRDNYLVPLGLSQAELAKGLCVDRSRVSRLLSGETALTPDTAVRLGLFFETPARWWLDLQTEYDLAQAAVVPSIRPWLGVDTAIIGPRWAERLPEVKDAQVGRAVHRVDDISEEDLCGDPAARGRRGCAANPRRWLGRAGVPRVAASLTLNDLRGVVADDILVRARDTSAQLTERGVPHLLIGGVAVGLHGHPRATMSFRW